MAGKPRPPTDAIAARGKPWGRHAVWEAVRAQPGPFTNRDIVLATELDEPVANRYLVALRRGGYIAPAGTVRRRYTGRAVETFTLVKDIGVEAPRIWLNGNALRRGLGREQMWLTMKMLSAAGDFTAADLAAAATSRQARVALRTAQNYIGFLVKGRYLAVTRKPHGEARGSGEARYRLIDNTGPRPPIVTAVNTVVDANTFLPRWHAAPREDA